MYVLGPYVWREEGTYHLLGGAVNHADDPRQKVARIYHGQGDDGPRFVMDREPARGSRRLRGSVRCPAGRRDPDARDDRTPLSAAIS